MRHTPTGDGSVRRAALDRDILISRLLSPGGTTRQILVHFRWGAFELITSTALIDELGEVLRRERFRRYVTEEEVNEFVALIVRESTRREDPAPTDERLGTDPDDECLIRLARAWADILVSGDYHLTRLRGRIRVETPRELLESLD